MIPLRDTQRSQTTPWVVYLLIAVNALVFLFEMSLSEPALQRTVNTFGMVPARLSSAGTGSVDVGVIAAYASLLSSMFLHGDLLHILGNMWILFIFGDNVEDRMGHGRFLIFYLLAGLAAGLVHFVSDPGSTVPTVGASGAIAGVMGAYLLLFPGARVLTAVPVFYFLTFVTLPAWVFLLVWFAIQLVQGLAVLQGGEGVSNIAWWAHAGGFAAGMAMRFVFAKRKQQQRF